MKELTIKVYSFDELPKEAQDKIIERERWNVMDNAMEFSRMEFDDTLKEFERITDSRVTGLRRRLYCGYNFGRV